MTESSSSHATPARDEETARLLAAGDPEGLCRLLIDYLSRVRWTLRKDFDKVLDQSDIDDAISQATQRIWRSGKRFDLNRGTLRAWFYVIARNCALRILEGRRGPRALRYVENLDSLTSRRTATSEAVQSVERELFVRDLYACINKLPAQQRAVVLADLAAGGTARTEHLVKQLKTSTNTIYVARATARKTLRQELLRRGHPGSEGNAREAMP